MGILNALGGNDIGVKGDISPNYVIPGVVAFWIIGMAFNRPNQTRWKRILVILLFLLSMLLHS